MQLSINKPKRILIAGGGTGGHLFPGLAVAEELRRRFVDVELLFVGTERGIEARVLPERGEDVRYLDVTPLKGRGPLELARSLGRLPAAVTQARTLIREFAPDLVIGVGGYASGPAVVAATSLGVPAALLEQNAHLGMTNRMLAPVVGRAYVAFEAMKQRFGDKARLVGNPIRAELVAMALRAATDPDGFESRAEGILIFGGSQGAKAINEAAPAAIAELFEKQGRSYPVVHQTGAAMRDEVASAYAELGIDAEVVTFIDDMANAYAAARVVVSRAGATTLAELMALGRPAVLVPYPFAADDHQTVNARALEQSGAALCLPQNELNGASLASSMAELLAVDRSQEMSVSARELGRPDAAAAIVDDLCDWLGWPSGASSAGNAHGQARSHHSTPPPPKTDAQEATGPRLRGHGFYSPLMRRASTLPPPPRRALVSDDGLGWT